MNAVHDLGGMQGFGEVVREAGEPAFHADWEGRVLALQRAVLYTRAANLDGFRHAQESLSARTYLSISYYHRWLLALTKLTLDLGLVQGEELQTGHALAPAKPLGRRLTRAEVAAAYLRSPFGRNPQGSPRFKPGDAVRTKNLHPEGHTRLPRYARDKVGRIEALCGCHVFADSSAAGMGDDPQWVYTVVFDGRTLWGEPADASLTVSIEAFEPYLEAC